MGAYLSTPVTTKEVFEGGCSTTTYGGGSMQGWRRTMEDAHIAETGLRADADVAIFGVFDGHGGAEVAKFCQKYMAAEMTKLGRFSEGGIEESLVEVFHRMDDMLRDHEYAEELEQLKTKDDMDDEDSRGDSEGDGVSMDAIEMLKRVFQIKRWQGDAPPGGPGAGGGEEGDSMAMDGDAAAAAAGGGSAGSPPSSASAATGSGEPPQAQPSPPVQQQQLPPQPGGAPEPAAAASSSAAAGAAPPPPSSLARFLEPAERVQAGCTAVVAVKYGNELYVANAGDSRGVLCRSGQAIALSEDHKPAHETERTRILNAGGFGCGWWVGWRASSSWCSSALPVTR
jgi:protein phosphatase 1G